jgi:hypothetical protein
MKYKVAKIEDIEKYLNSNEQQLLSDLLLVIAHRRIMEGKNPINEYWVVNKDEPYSKQIEALIHN